MINLELNILKNTNKKKQLRGNKNIKTYGYRIQGEDLIKCGFFCIGFINFMLKVKYLLDYTRFFSPHEYKKNNKVILKYFQ